eukprot:890301-Rhodomonas_salina.4
MSGTELAYGYTPTCLLCDVRYWRDTWMYAYAPAMRCPILTWHMAVRIRACYPMSGADIAYGARRSHMGAPRQSVPPRHVPCWLPLCERHVIDYLPTHAVCRTQY